MKVLLTTLHSRYIHSSLALPYLASVCGDLTEVPISIREFTINDVADRVKAAIIAENADVVAFSCYIWNIEKTLELASEIKKSRPGIFILLGGPEVSFDAPDILKKNDFIDFIIEGEGEFKFRRLMKEIIKEGPERVISKLSCSIDNRVGKHDIDTDLDLVPSPFAANLVDISKPLVYYETCRGCPFSCAFCLSANDNVIRKFSFERIKSDLEYLMENKVKTVKFVDRTFNFSSDRANKIWKFILEKNLSSAFHFEISADLLNDENIGLLKDVPEDTFRFEIGVQSVSEDTLASVGRRANMSKLVHNIKRLIDETDVKIHLDLLAGLPGEDFNGFLKSLENIIALKADHIQVGVLKMLKGSPMINIASKEGYSWSKTPPYRIIRTPWLSEEEIERIEIIGRLIGLFYNSGRFEKTLEIISETIPASEVFNSLAGFWIREKITTLSLEGLFEFLWKYLLHHDEILPDITDIADAMVFDRCMIDYPGIAKLPSYFKRDKEHDCRVKKEELKLIRKDLNISGVCRVRAFAWHFNRDFGALAGGNEAGLLFIYLSGSGEKQTIRTKLIGSGKKK